MQFTISVYHNKKQLKLTCECIYISDQIERYKVSITKNRFIILENNRPAVKLRNKNYNKYKWLLREGPATIEFDFLRRLFSELEDHIKKDGVTMNKKFVKKGEGLNPDILNNIKPL